MLLLDTIVVEFFCFVFSFLTQNMGTVGSVNNFADGYSREC